MNQALILIDIQNDYFPGGAMELVGNAVTQRLSRWPHARIIATRLAGMSLIGFGVRLALNQR